jgi:hypothetical protein
MMRWTYRVFRDQQERYSIREVFYEHDQTIIDYSKEPVAVVGASFEELIQLVQWFREAFDLPVLSLEEVEAQKTAQKTQLSNDRVSNISLQQAITQLTSDASSVNLGAIEEHD